MRLHLQKWPLKLWLSIGILTVVLGLTILGPLLGRDPNFIDPNHPTAAPAWPFLFGTDELGRDVFSRLAVGAQIFLTDWPLHRGGGCYYWNGVWHNCSPI